MFLKQKKGDSISLLLITTMLSPVSPILDTDSSIGPCLLLFQGEVVSTF